MNIFGTPKQVVDPLEQAKEWKRHMSREQRSMERDIVRIKKEESKAMAECKKLAKSGNISAVKIIAKEIVR
jgi:charged multivesicular body protein 2A